MISKVVDDAALLHTSLKTKLGHAIEGGVAIESIFDIKCSRSHVAKSLETQYHDYTLVWIDVDIDVHPVNVDSLSKDDQSDCFEELLAVINTSIPLVHRISWSGRILMVVPMRSGYLTRTKCFEERFVGCAELGIIHDRTVVGKSLSPVSEEDLLESLQNSVLLFIRSAENPLLSSDASTVEEIHARIGPGWLLDNQPKQKTLAIVDGHLNLDSYLPMYYSAVALGVKVIVLDRPGHWISDPSLSHLYEDFIPIDMTPDDDFHVRIAIAIKAYGGVDGVCAIATACLAPVARAAVMLGLSTELPESVACANNKYQMRLVAGGAAPATSVTDVSDLRNQMIQRAFVPQYPLIVKPSTGAGSVYVYKVHTEAELLDGVKRTSEGSRKKVLIEAYIDGPELDVNLVLLNGDLVFFEIADDFPSPGDTGTMEGDFWENTNTLPSILPANEYAVVRQTLHELLLKIGLRTGVFHLEARVQDSCMAFIEQDGIVDLRSQPNVENNDTPRCVLIEVNPRPPGFPCVIATAATYGVNFYDLHVLASLGEQDRFRSLATPFKSDAIIPNHARAWSQIVFLRADKGGICDSDDACGEVIQRLPPQDRALITTSMCFYRRGMRIPEPKPGVIQFGAFFFVISRKNREDVLRVSRILQKEFSIPVIAA